MEQQTVDLGPFLQRIDELIPTEKKDSYYLIVGELLTHFPEYLWQRLGMLLAFHLAQCLRPRCGGSTSTTHIANAVALVAFRGRSRGS